MKLKMIDTSDVTFANSKLAKFYENQLIPAEKKTYLPNLEKSYGPYLAIETSTNDLHYMMDAASQIATLGHGFNPSIYNGLLHHQFVLNDEKDDKTLIQLKKSFTDLMQRNLNWKSLELTYCHSGAEANEIALGHCFENRVNKKAKKVLAFEDSFHGRMLVSLSSTWNPSKRALFEWDNYLTEFTKAPASKEGKVYAKLNEGWLNFWSMIKNNPQENFDIEADNIELQEEYKCLLSVKEKLDTGEIFSIIIEPMQCEGGDRYLNNSFVNALMVLAKSYQIPIIMDEVQTGFHLGQNFFWHNEFKLVDQENKALEPNYVICAKKAQVGLVISHSEIVFKQLEKRDEFSNSSLYRGYIQALSLTQSHQKIHNINIETKKRLEDYISKYSNFINSPRSNGLAFSFDFNDSTNVTKFVSKRFDYGLLFYPAGSNTLRFRLTTSFTNDDLDFLFNQLDSIASDVLLNKKERNIVEIERPYEKYIIERKWQSYISKAKEDNSKNWNKILSDSEKLFNQDYSDFKIVEINKNNFNNFKQEIINIENELYEKSRQTDIEKFELAANQDTSFCFAITNKDDKLIAITFSGLLSLFPNENGIKEDIDFNKKNSLYMLDTSVVKEYQNMSLGKILKYLNYLKAFSNNIKSISGRNRDQYASSMLSVNLSLGAIEQFYLKDDYSDNLEFKDCIYYKYPICDLTIDQKQTYQNSSIINQETNGALINKICLSNFSSINFLENVKTMSERVDSSLRHLFTTSGQSECVDKIVKSLWVNSNHETNLLCSFDGHYFGQGSFLSRDLSQSKHNDHFFEVKHFNQPTEQNEDNVLEEIAHYLKNNKVFAFFMEPLTTYDKKKISLSFIKKLKNLLSINGVYLVFNETSSSQYKYSPDFEILSSQKELLPDGAFIYLGGQAGIVYLKKELHYSQPLMMISTWDGDEHSFAQATKNLKGKI